MKPQNLDPSRWAFRGYVLDTGRKCAADGCSSAPIYLIITTGGSGRGRKRRFIVKKYTRALCEKHAQQLPKTLRMRIPNAEGKSAAREASTPDKESHVSLAGLQATSAPGNVGL